MPEKVAIIGGGISGLVAGWYIRRKFGEKVELALYEKDNRLGGTIGTTRENGYLIDWGSNGFLDREPLTLEFIKNIGLSDKLYRSNDKSTKRYIFRNGKLWEIKAHPVKFMQSGLLSLRGRIRLASEMLIPQKKDDRDETIFDFAARRIGKEAASAMIDPMVSGIYGGDAKALSLRSCFPVMEKMEREYGSLIKAMIKKQKEAKRRKKAGSGPAGPGGHLTSFRGGLYTLIEHLGELLKEHIRLSSELRRVRRNDRGQYILEFVDHTDTCDYLIMAVPSYHAAEALQEISSDLSDRLKEIPYSSLAVVAQGFKTKTINRSLDGFGFLVPHSENLNLLGSIWTSVIFPEQAPEGSALFRTMLGGALNGGIINKPLGEISKIAYDELAPILGLTEKPSEEHIYIWNRAIPQYVMGHPERLEKIERILSETPGLFLTGNAYDGIGLNDCIKRSHRIVENLEI